MDPYRRTISVQEAGSTGEQSGLDAEIEALWWPAFWEHCSYPQLTGDYSTVIRSSDPLPSVTDGPQWRAYLDAVPEVSALEFGAGVPGRLLGINVVVGARHVIAKTNIIEYEKFRLGTKISRVGNSARLQKSFRTLRQRARAAAVESATWRANPDWATKLGYNAESLAANFTNEAGGIASLLDELYALPGELARCPVIVGSAQ